MDLDLINAQPVLDVAESMLHLPDGEMQTLQSGLQQVMTNNPTNTFEISQAIRSRLEQVDYHLQQFNSSDSIRDRFSIKTSWRANERTQEPFLLISVDNHQISSFPPGYLSLVPTFHLVAKCSPDVNDERVILRLVAFNGVIVDRVDENLYDIEQDLLRSKLLGNFLDNRFTMCFGLAKLPLRTQLHLLKKSNFLRERLDDRIVWRSDRCHYAIEKSADGIALNCCDECRSFLDPLVFDQDHSGSNSPIDDEDLIADLLEDKQITLERLDRLKSRGITINQTKELQKLTTIEQTCPNDETFNTAEEFLKQLEDGTPTNDENDSIEIIPNSKITVTITEGSETKVVPLEMLRQYKLAGSSDDNNKKIKADLAKKRKMGIDMQEEKIKKPKKDQAAPNHELDEEAVVRVQNHVKKCPICQEPFTDVNLFMSHLSNCSITSEEEDDDAGEDDLAEDLDIGDGQMQRKSGAQGTLKLGSSSKKKKKKNRSFPLTALSCGICGQTFKFETHYEPHVQAHEEKLKLDVEVTCPVCHEVLPTKRHLNPHFRKIHPNDGGCCVECLQIMEVSALKQHLQKMHQQSGAAGGTKESVKGEGHLCPDCGKKCQYLSELEIHMAIQHMGITLERPSTKEEDVMCHECGKVFNHRYRLKQHLSTTHNKSRDHHCPFCTKVFCLKHQLTKHLLTHSDVKPFKCKYCEYQNVRKYRVQKHCQKAHQVRGTDADIETMEGGAKPSEFVQNFLNIPEGKQKLEIIGTIQIPDRQMFQ